MWEQRHAASLVGPSPPASAGTASELRYFFFFCFFSFGLLATAHAQLFLAFNSYGAFALVGAPRQPTHPWQPCPSRYAIWLGLLACLLAVSTSSPSSSATRATVIVVDRLLFHLYPDRLRAIDPAFVSAAQTALVQHRLASRSRAPCFSPPTRPAYPISGSPPSRFVCPSIPQSSFVLLAPHTLQTHSILRQSSPCLSSLASRASSASVTGALASFAILSSFAILFFAGKGDASYHQSLLRTAPASCL